VRSSFKFFIVPLLLKWLLLLLVMTCRVRYHNKDQYDQLLADEKPFVMCLWHDCSTIAGWVMRNSPVTVMVSDSRDGEYVSRFSNLMGIKTMRGSTSRGAGKVIKAALKLLARKQPIAVTPDGPRGPRYKLQSGALWFAASSGSPIIGMHIQATREWVFKSWDQHRFPKPFSTIHVRFADALTIERERLEQDLTAVTAEVEAVMMHNVATTADLIDRA